jgi:hypothetical protein
MNRPDRTRRSPPPGRPDAAAAPAAAALARSRRRVALALIALGALLGLVALVRPGDDEPDPPPGTPVAHGPRAAFTRAVAAASPPPSSPARAAGAPPVIDAIEVEKTEVCSGEENLVTVRAHTPDGTDAFLHYAVGGATGERVPVRVWRQPDGSYELPEVSVFGRHNVVARAQVPPFRVNDCRPARAVHVQSRALANAPSEFEFFARVADVGAKDAPDAPPFRPQRYHWTFGDGTSETTAGPLVTHSYRARPQTSLYSQLLVAVEVLAESGDKLTGRAAVELLNSAFEDFDQKRIVSLTAAPEPRFPELGRDGVVRQAFHLSHQRPTPVRVTRVRAVRHAREGDGPPPGAETVDGALGLAEIAPGEGATVSLALDTRRDPDVYSITYLVDGVTPEGYAVRGSFSLMRPPPPPSKDSHTPVDDPQLVAKIKRARELLHQEFVTDEDIWRLEREGKLADLGARPSPPEGEAN